MKMKRCGFGGLGVPSRRERYKCLQRSLKRGDVNAQETTAGVDALGFLAAVARAVTAEYRNPIGMAAGPSVQEFINQEILKRKSAKKQSRWVLLVLERQPEVWIECW